MKAFVTGGTGLLGNNLVRLLLERGHTVTALVRSKEKAASVLGGLPVELVEGDIENTAGFEAALSGCDTLFHTAAYFREYFGPGDHWARLKAVNVDATVRLLEAAERRGVGRTVHVSSSGVIGPGRGGAPADESAPPDAVAMANLYFRSKVAAEEAVARFLERSRLPVVLALPVTIWGPGDAAPTAMGRHMLDFLARRLPGVLDGGFSTVDARDVAAGMLLAAECGKSGERYILSEGYHSMADIYEALEAVSGVRAPRLPIPQPVALGVAWASETVARLTGRPAAIPLEGVRSMHMKRVVTSDKARRELGATFRPLRDTLRDEVAWFRERGYLEPGRRGVAAVST